MLIFAEMGGLNQHNLFSNLHEICTFLCDFEFIRVTLTSTFLGSFTKEIPYLNRYFGHFSSQIEIIIFDYFEIIFINFHIFGDFISSNFILPNFLNFAFGGPVGAPKGPIHLAWAGLCPAQPRLGFAQPDRMHIELRSIAFYHNNKRIGRSPISLIVVELSFAQLSAAKLRKRREAKLLFAYGLRALRP